MYSAASAVYGACSTINVYSVRADNNWFLHGQAVYNNVTGSYDHPNKKDITFEMFVKEMHGTVSRFSNHTGMFVSLRVDVQSQAIKWFKTVGFKFCRPTHNTKNATTVQLGIGTMPRVKAKCEKLLKEMKDA